MLIGIDASRAVREQKTGVEWYAHHVIENLVKLDVQNQFVLYCDKKPDDWLKKIGERANVKIKRLRWPFKFLWTQGRFSLEMLLCKLHGIPACLPVGMAFAGMTKERPDVLFIPASAMPIIHPKNTVAAIHDVGFMQYPESYGRWQRRYLKWSTRFAVKYAKKIITISEFSKQELVKYFFTPSYSPPLKEGENLADKIFVTHLGYDAAKFKVIENREAVNNVLTKYGISQPFVLSVGRLEKKKNIDGLIRAWAILKNTPSYSPPSQGGDGRGYNLVLAGSPGHGFAEIKELIKDNNLAEGIIILDYVSQQDLPVLYNAAAVFVLPSWYEGFGLPILEAFACGAPVVSSNAASLPEVGGEAALYVEPKDYQALARAIAIAASDENLRQELITKGRERVRQFGWEKCAVETLKIFKKVRQ